MSAWNHSSGHEASSPPVGKGLTLTRTEFFKGSFFMKTAAGREAYETSQGDREQRIQSRMVLRLQRRGVAKKRSVKAKRFRRLKETRRV